MFEGTHISNAEWNRDEARDVGYVNIDAHPRRVGTLTPGQFLAIDAANIAFDDVDEAVALAVAHARRGVHVGIHAGQPDDTRLAPARAEATIVLGRTHREVLAVLELRAFGGTAQSNLLAEEPTAAPAPEQDEHELLLWLAAALAEIAGG